MAWEKRKGRGRYYTRSRRRNGRIVREYVGTGEIAELAALIDEEGAECRRQELEARRTDRARIQAVEADVVEVCRLADLLARLALLATGHHQHHRGEWRRKREQNG